MILSEVDWSRPVHTIARELRCSKRKVSAIKRGFNLPMHRGGRQNEEVWSKINWQNTDHAIARRLKCVEASVRYQRQKRGIPPYAGRGGDRYNHPEYREGPTPLPKVIPPL